MPDVNPRVLTVIENVVLSDDERKLLDLVPEAGGTISNPAVQKSLSWTDEVYWTVRNTLVDKGVLARGQGRGGTVRRILALPETETVTVAVTVPDSVTDVVEQAALVHDAIKRELELYEPMAAVIRGDWARERRAHPLAVEVTALQGRRSTGGTWSRPDIVSVEIKTYAYVPGKFLEVVTYEIKPADAIDVQAVYESLAHRRSATHSYVILHVPEHRAAQLQESIHDVCMVARSHGIGVVTAGDPSNYDTWEELEDAERSEPDPDRLDMFITTQLSDQTKSKIARGLR